VGVALLVGSALARTVAGDSAAGALQPQAVHSAMAATASTVVRVKIPAQPLAE
jgi:hypothetical protein